MSSNPLISVINFIEKEINYKILILGFLFVGINIINAYNNFLPGICSGLGDCVKYTLMHNSYMNSDFPTAIEYPFNLRFFVPLLSCYLDLTSNLGIEKVFFLINIFSGLTVTFFMYLILKHLKLSNFHYIIFIVWFFYHPIGFSLYYFVPISVDPFSYAVMSILLYSYVVRNYLLVAISLFIGLISKESFLFIAVIMLIIETFSIFNKKKENNFYFIIWILAVVLIYFFIKNYFIMNIFPQLQSWKITSLSTILYWTNEVLLDQNKIIVWFCAVFCSMGGMILLIFNYKSYLKIFEDRNLLFLFLISNGYIIFGLIAGSDMTRIIFNGSLFIMVLIFLVSKKNALLISLFLISITSTYLYTNWFPSAIEYEYYSSKEIYKYYIYLLVLLVTCLCVMFFFNKRKKV